MLEILLFLLCYLVIVNATLHKETADNSSLGQHHHLTWLVTHPASFHSQSSHSTSIPQLHNVCGDKSKISTFVEFISESIPHIIDPFDGENVDAIEHFFWGMRDGIALEVGALDGSKDTRSVTYDFEYYFGWRRILIEANPMYREGLRSMSPNTFGVIAPICDSHSTVHYVVRPEYVGGILEFMTASQISKHFKNIYDLLPSSAYQDSQGYVNLSAIHDWKNVESVITVDCMPLKHVLHKAGIKHVNFAVLSTQGSELDILRSINWNHTTFDVLVVETDPPYRPRKYSSELTSYLAARGYRNVTGQLGKNIWYKRDGFQASRRPGISGQCYNGNKHAEYTYETRINHGSLPFDHCPTVDGV